MTEDDSPKPTDNREYPGAPGTPYRIGSPPLTDLDAYRLLIRLGHTMQHLSARSSSTAAATALAAAARALRLLASALYRANIRDPSHWTDRP